MLGNANLTMPWRHRALRAQPFFPGTILYIIFSIKTLTHLYVRGVSHPHTTPPTVFFFRVFKNIRTSLCWNLSTRLYLFREFTYIQTTFLFILLFCHLILSWGYSSLIQFTSLWIWGLRTNGQGNLSLCLRERYLWPKPINSWPVHIRFFYVVTPLSALPSPS